MNSRLLIAFGSVPKDGGTFTFYRNMRRPLLEHGIDLRCVSVGLQEAELWQAEYQDEGCVLLAGRSGNRKTQAKAFVEWCRKERVDIVFAVNSVAILSALPHLPEGIRTLARCANAFDHGYRITVSCYDRLSRIVALAPRQVTDLVQSYGAEEDRITLIPNGTSVERFEDAARQERGGEKTVRLGFLGRLEHHQKGVLFLPAILKRLQANGLHFTLDIAGQGVHQAALRRELAEFEESGVVNFTGVLKREEIAGFFSSVDVFLFPSQFEGSPNALIEAMMAGCVPAAWVVHGITDFVIDDGCSGVLADPGDCLRLADRITELADNRALLRRMSTNAHASAGKRFSLERLVSDYLALFDLVMDEPPRFWRARPWSNFRVDPSFRQSRWKSMIPVSVKRALRNILYRMPTANGNG